MLSHLEEKNILDDTAAFLTWEKEALWKGCGGDPIS